MVAYWTTRQLIVLRLITTSCIVVAALQTQPNTCSRRTFFLTPAVGAVAIGLGGSLPAVAAEKPNGPGLEFATSTSGLQWADAKVGTGPEPKKGSAVSADYVMSTTGARYGSKIYGTAESGAPYRWVLGDNASTIQGLNEAVMGGNGIPPMRPGGIRRVFIPQNLAYASLGQSSSGSSGCDKGVGPVPPVPEAFEEFQRFKNIYCNPNRAYQPDIVLDIKLYGKRSVD